MPKDNGSRNSSNLTAKRLCIDTHLETVAYIHRDSPICRAEGFQVHVRVKVQTKTKSILATLNMVDDDFLQLGELGLSEYAWQLLGAEPGEQVTLAHREPLESLASLRAKIYGHELDQAELDAVIADISRGLYSDIHIASFLTACAGGRLSHREVVHLTQSMVKVGSQLNWPAERIVDKHCIGGLPGNRTTLIVVPIVAAFGLMIPKSSSRAITSPAGTADTMEVLAPVDINLATMRKVVEQENGCIVWGRNIELSPADDVLITVERAMDIDSPGQLVASVLSKKISAGSSHVVIDIPTGESAKVRSAAMADQLKQLFNVVAKASGIEVSFCFSDGRQPVGYGIGPSLEARDVLSVLQNEFTAPMDLRQRALTLAGKIIEFSPEVKSGEGIKIAADILSSGKAWQKFQSICEAQGGLREPQSAQFTQEIVADRAGQVVKFDNRNLARLAKLAGAPHIKEAGLLMQVRLDDKVEKGQPLFIVHAQSQGELNYALEFYRQKPNIIMIKEL